MKERAVDGQRSVIAHDQAAVVADPADGSLDDPAPFVAPKGATVLRARSGPVLMVRGDQFDAPPGQPLAQRVTVVTAVGDHALGLLSGTTGTVPSPYPDRLERPLRQPDFRRGCRVKVVSQRKTRAIGPPSGAVDVRDPPPQQNNYSKFSPLYRVLQCVLAGRLPLLFIQSAQTAQT